MNHVVIIGNLARDPELRFTGTGKAVASMTVAVSRGFGKDKEADFIPVVVWEKTAENCANYLSKGSKVAVQGRIQVRSYETQNGDKRYATEVVATNVEFLSTPGKTSDSGDYQAARPPQKKESGNSGFNPDEIDLKEFETMEEDDDLPF